MIMVTAAAKWPGAGSRIAPDAVASKKIAVSVCKKKFTRNAFVNGVCVTARLLAYHVKVNKISRRPVIRLDTRQMIEGEIWNNASNEGSMLQPAAMKLRNKVLRMKNTSKSDSRPPIIWRKTVTSTAKPPNVIEIKASVCK